jgi:hypothetical protein
VLNHTACFAESSSAIQQQRNKTRQGERLALPLFLLTKPNHFLCQRFKTDSLSVDFFIFEQVKFLEEGRCHQHMWLWMMMRRSRIDSSWSTARSALIVNKIFSSLSAFVIYRQIRVLLTLRSFHATRMFPTDLTMSPAPKLNRYDRSPPLYGSCIPYFALVY